VHRPSRYEIPHDFGLMWNVAARSSHLNNRNDTATSLAAWIQTPCPSRDFYAATENAVARKSGADATLPDGLAQHLGD